MTINILLWLGFVWFEIGRNYFLIEGLEIRPHYGISAFIRFIAGGLFFFHAYPDPATAGFISIVYGLFQWTSFYILFDLILNKLRGKDWDYRGKNSGSLDKLPDTKYYLLKAGSLVVLILTLIVMYGH